MLTNGPYTGEARCLKHEIEPAAGVFDTRVWGYNDVRRITQSRQFIPYNNINSEKQFMVPVIIPVTFASGGRVIKAPRTIADLPVRQYATEAQAGSGQGLRPFSENAVFVLGRNSLLTAILKP